MKFTPWVATAVVFLGGTSTFAGVHYSSGSYSADISFSTAPIPTTTTIAFDGTNYWSTSGGNTSGNRYAQYDASGSTLATYAPGMDFRSVFTDASGTVYARTYSSNIIYEQAAPGIFANHVALSGAYLDSQSSVVMNANGEYVAMFNGTVNVWDASGNFSSSFALSGYNVTDFVARRGIAVVDDYLLTYFDQTLTAWDYTGNLLAQTTLTGASTGSLSYYSFSYANNRAFIIDAAGNTWQGYTFLLITPPDQLVYGTPGYLYLNNPSTNWQDTVWRSSPTSPAVIWGDGCDALFIGSNATYRVTLDAPVTVRGMGLTGGQLTLAASNHPLTFTDPRDDAATIDVALGSSLTFDVPLTATGGLTRTGAGDVIFNRPLSINNSFTLLSGNTLLNSTATVGGRTTVQGNLTVNGELMSRQLAIANNGEMIINDTASVTEETTVEGILTVNGDLTSRQLEIVNNGEMIINDTASITEETTVEGILTVNGDLASRQLAIANNGEMIINNTTSIAENTTVAGILTVNGTMNTGTFTIESAGNAWINGRVNADSTDNYGYLRVNGTLDSPLANRGFLGGSGTINGSVYNHKIISPGNSIGTLSVNGTYIHGSGATFIAEIDQYGSSDRLNVSGTATLNGGTVATSLPRALYPAGYAWNFLQAAGGINGQFATLSGQPDSSVLNLSLDYTTTQASIQVNRKSYASFTDDTGAKSIGYALDSYVPLARGKGDAMESLLIAMDFDYSPDTIATLLSELNPEIYPTFLVAQQQAASRFSRNMRLRSCQVRALNALALEESLDKTEIVVPQVNGGQLKAASHYPAWLVWGKAQGESVFKDATTMHNGYDFRTGGATIGADTQLSDTIRFGIATAFERTDMEWQQGANGTQDNIMAGLYAAGQHKGYYADIQAAVGFHDNNAFRIVLNAPENTDFNGQSYMAHIGAGYDFTSENYIFGPLASLSYTHIQTSDFSESSNRSLSLNVNDSDDNLFLSYLGLHATSKFPVGESQMTTRMEIGWQHDFHGDQFEMNGWYKGYPAFTFAGPGLDQDMLIAQAEATLSLGEQLSTYIELGGALGDGSKTYNISVGLHWQF